MNSALPGVKLVSTIYKNSTSELTEEIFILNNYVICFPLLGFLDLSPELNSELYQDRLPTLYVIIFYCLGLV